MSDDDIGILLMTVLVVVFVGLLAIVNPTAARIAGCLWFAVVLFLRIRK